MVGAIIMVILLVIVFPVAVIMSGAVVAAVLGHFLRSSVDEANVDDDGAPNEYLALARADHHRN